MAWMWGNGTIIHWWWECKLVQPLWKSMWSFPRRLEIHLPPDPAIPLYSDPPPKGLYILIHRSLLTLVYGCFIHNN